MKAALLALAITLAATSATSAPAAEKSKTAKSPVSTTKPPKPDPDLIPPEEESEHIVREGETLGGIAIRAKVPRVLIIEANRLKEPFAVKTGQRLMLPRTRTHVVKKGETGFDIAMKYGVPFDDIAVANALEMDAALKVGQTLRIPTVIAPPKPEAKPDPKPEDKSEAEPTEKPRLTWPLEGKIRRGFTPRGKTDATGDYHEGLDIPADPGTAARAVAGGTVLFAGKEPESFGNLVVIDHGNGWQSAYGFLSKITVKKGAPVAPHERVGLVGHTGKATRDELHFELRRANKPVDPVEFLPKPKKPAAKPSPKKPHPSA
jgi:murein DD-endopeptidase MepM/ murein hydrolase activator NlpD